MWKKVKEGKVRDIYLSKDGKQVKIIASDRVSAFDKVLPVFIPNKGQVLTSISKAMFDVTEGIFPNAYIKHKDLEPNEIIMLRLDMIPVEFIVRGYLFGSLWADYENGVRNFYGNIIPDGLLEGDILPEPIFTPTTKDDAGDRPITLDEMKKIFVDFGLDEDNAYTLKQASIDLYKGAADFCREKGFILADTKFEFGVDCRNGNDILLADEVCTPDSSRFWEINAYNSSERKIVSADKQVIRDYIKRQKNLGRAIDKIPDGIIAETQIQYARICKALTGKEK